MDLCAPLMPHVTSLWALRPLPLPLYPPLSRPQQVCQHAVREIYMILLLVLLFFSLCMIKIYLFRLGVL